MIASCLGLAFSSFVLPTIFFPRPRPRFRVLSLSLSLVSVIPVVLARFVFYSPPTFAFLDLNGNRPASIQRPWSFGGHDRLLYFVSLVVRLRASKRYRGMDGRPSYSCQLPRVCGFSSSATEISGRTLHYISSARVDKNVHFYAVYSTTPPLHIPSPTPTHFL